MRRFLICVVFVSLIMMMAGVGFAEEVKEVAPISGPSAQTVPATEAGLPTSFQPGPLCEGVFTVICPPSRYAK